jgi:hypothetical protein
MNDLLIFVGFIVLYFVVSKFLFPKLGIPT